MEQYLALIQMIVDQIDTDDSMILLDRISSLINKEPIHNFMRSIAELQTTWYKTLKQNGVPDEIIASLAKLQYKGK